MANNKIQVKRTSTAGRTPNTTNAGNTQYIAAGELALNMTDQTFFTSDGTNLIYVGSNVVNKNVSNTLTVKAISANGSNGTSGYVLATNSTGTYWAPPSAVVGAINYAQNAAPQTYANSVVTPTILAQIAITTSGNPVQIIASGDANPLSAGGWGVLQLYRGTTAIGGTVNFESSAANENVPYSLQFIDAPAAGSYTYSLKVNSTTNNTQFGETSGPVISVVELQNVVGTMNTAAQYNFTNVETFSNTVIHTNDKRAVFAPLAGGTNVYFTQQADDNFVFYSTNSTNGSRAVWSIFANNNTSNLTFSTQTTFNGNVDLNIVAVYANGSPGTAGQVLTSNGTSTYWTSAGAAAVNTAAQYTWTNTQTFSANISFTGNGIGLATNTGAIYLGGIADTNWKIGRNTGVTTKWKYTNNTIDIVTANSNLEGMAIGLVNGNSYFETGYLGTFIANTVTIGNSASNSTVNSTVFSGTANNASYLGGTLASGYQTTAGLSANVATLTSNNSTYFGGYTWAAPAILGGSTANGASLSYANVSGRVNTATLYTSTSANLAAQYSNTIGFYPTSNTVGQLLGNTTARWVINANTINMSGTLTSIGISANTISMTNAITATAINMSNVLTSTSATASGNQVSGAIIVAGGLGVNGNIYTGGRVGFGNTLNSSVIYTYYNQTTNSLDTVFG